MWAGTRGAGVWKTLNRGQTWQLSSAPVEDVDALALDPQHPDTVFVVGDLSLLRTLDGGAHWLTSTNGLQNAFILGSVLVDPQHSTVVVTTASGIFWSGDTGASWSPSTGAECTFPTTLAAGADGPIYLGGFPIQSCGTDDTSRGGVFASTDGGMTWEGATTAWMEWTGRFSP